MSPISQQWWVLCVPLALAVVLTLAAFAVSARRDLGTGLLPERAGPLRPAPRSAFGLAWRLYGGQVVSWTISLGVVAAGVGWVSASFEVGTLTGDTLLEVFTYVFCMVIACPFGYVHPSISAGFAAPAGFALAAAALVTVGGAAFARRDLLA